LAVGLRPKPLKKTHNVLPDFIAGFRGEAPEVEGKEGRAGDEGGMKGQEEE